MTTLMPYTTATAKTAAPTIRPATGSGPFLHNDLGRRPPEVHGGNAVVVRGGDES
ncbi:hypothetical protein [Amycolatopsis pithecellobii]|uniref:Uncharacterized protein n=1 Tax=Amycolatopsis pithecellobii TaxID=664692 RepID=A0A6N7YUA1_9PSEU|nr:hypothetical protein [Amycolatopsis pithecellobii]MTD55508.1 hypothetical protein [Amycolatopsis pithecellobii]